MQFRGAAAAEIRLVGIDRPGYGGSTPLPGRSVVDWVDDCLLVADTLEFDRFAVAGASTGGAYALAVAATVPERVITVMLVSSITDMSNPACRELARGTGGAMIPIWDAPDRDTALRLALDYWGEDGTAIRSRTPDPKTRPVPPADVAYFVKRASDGLSPNESAFAQGVQGYADDRIADGVGWGSFDVTGVRCPVMILHGEEDSLAPLAFAHHNKRLLPHAELRVLAGHGHLSVLPEVATSLRELLARAE